MEFVELLSLHNLYPTITKPTRITHASAMLIDNIFVKKERYGNYRSMLLVDDLSDHLPCLVTLDNLEPEKKVPDLIWKSSLNDKNIKKIENKLQDIDWDIKIGNQSCDESFNIFHDILMNTIDDCAPERPVKRKTTKTSQPWITSGLKRCIKKQCELYKTHLEAPADDSKLSTYKKYKACLQRVIRNCKRKYYSDLCEKHKCNTKRLWEIMNKILKRENNKTNIIDCLEINNIKTYEAQEIANEFGKHFSSIGKWYANKTKIPKKKYRLLHLEN